MVTFTSSALLNVSTTWLHHPPHSTYFRPPRLYLRSKSDTWRFVIRTRAFLTIFCLITYNLVGFVVINLVTTSRD